MHDTEDRDQDRKSKFRTKSSRMKDMEGNSGDALEINGKTQLLDDQHKSKVK